MEAIDYKSAKPVVFKKWIPKKWKPEYERVVAMSAAGMSNKQIAKNVGFTPVHVSNILNLPQATDLMERIVARMRQQTLTNIPDALQRIAEKGVQRLESAMNNDDLFEKSPFAVIDRGLKVMEGLQHLKGGGNGSPSIPGNTTINGNVLVVSEAQADSLATGLQKLQEVRRLHSPPSQEVKVEDADTK